MKKLLLVLFVLASNQLVAQLTSSTIGQVYNFCVGDSFQYSYVETQGPCGPSGSELHIITSYNRTGDTITYSYARLSSINHSPCPNYYPPYGVLFDSSLVTQQILHADSSIFLPNPCQGLTHSQCYDSVYISTTGIFTGEKLNEYYYNDFSGTDNIWIDSLGLVGSYIGLEGTPPIEDQTDLIFYRKACNGATAGTFQPFPDYSVYLGINELSNALNLVLYPNPVIDNFEITVMGTSAPIGDGTMQLVVCNILGQQILRQNLTNGKIVVDCNLWPKGVYVWTVFNGDAPLKNGKLIVE